MVIDTEACPRGTLATQKLFHALGVNQLTADKVPSVTHRYDQQLGVIRMPHQTRLFRESARLKIRVRVVGTLLDDPRRLIRRSLLILDRPAPRG
jgi:hypothetical protein